MSAQEIQATFKGLTNQQRAAILAARDGDGTLSRAAGETGKWSTSGGTLVDQRVTAALTKRGIFSDASTQQKAQRKLVADWKRIKLEAPTA
jgi:hypothetical protein